MINDTSSINNNLPNCYIFPPTSDRKTQNKCDDKEFEFVTDKKMLRNYTYN